MSDRATSVSSSVLTWARERAGLSLSDVASYMHKDVDQIFAWESGEAWPTYNQLEHLAEDLYRRPVALFFLPEPPEEPAPDQEFRTLPDFDVRSLNSQTRFTVRLARSYQQSLRELTGGFNPSRKRLLVDLHDASSIDPKALASVLRDYLGVSLRHQQGWQTTADAMAGWRGSVEDAGIFVFKQPLKQREVSGFCLNDDQFPVIMINNSTPFSRQVFTLFHELAHLLYGVNSITTLDGDFVERMSASNRTIEIDCNRLAAEALVPSNSFPWRRVDLDELADSVSAIASDYKVSREVILRRVLDRGLIDNATYRECVDTWAEESDLGRESTGGNYYYNQAAYLGESFLRLAFSRYRAGVISISDLADHLGVKARNISKFEDVVYGRL
jgi:Zn-dependent peptidase ImmA (M78 family)/transcriptional regulator with XRE-family HTH domain